MILPAEETLLVTAVGGAELQTPRMVPALRPAVSLPAIAARADPEHRPAARMMTKPKPEYNFRMNRHPHMQAAFDKDNGSCHGKDNSEAAFVLA